MTAKTSGGRPENTVLLYVALVVEVLSYVKLTPEVVCSLQCDLFQQVLISLRLDNDDEIWKSTEREPGYAQETPRLRSSDLPLHVRLVEARTFARRDDRASVPVLREL